MNAVAGGGSFITFPTMVLLGMAPIPANATNTVGVSPASLAAVRALRDRMPPWRTLALPFLVALLGGTGGAILLLRTPGKVFDFLVPGLILGATLLFALSGRIGRRAVETAEGAPSHPFNSPKLLVPEVLIAGYGGFFGAGLGILLLAALAMAGERDIHLANGVKNLLSVAANGAAVVTFIFFGAVNWPFAIVVAVGSVVGGYLAARLSTRLSRRAMRTVVIVIGVVLTVYFTYRALRR